jgi:hypothetical protein
MELVWAWLKSLARRTIETQIIYYLTWSRIGNDVDKVSRDEIYHIIELGSENCIGKIKKTSFKI